MKLGISLDDTRAILKEEKVVPSELVPKLCEIFKCQPKDLIL
jgi:DNA-binding Xre family transcriptional regulator